MDNQTASLLERLRAVYSETTISHILEPHNDGRIPDADGYGCGSSGCGETMKIWLKIEAGVVRQTGFWTDGCAATVACGSMATELSKGKSVTQALAISAGNIADALEQLPEGNRHCAELAANTLRLALKDHLLMAQQPWKKLYRK